MPPLQSFPFLVLFLLIAALFLNFSLPGVQAGHHTSNTKPTESILTSRRDARFPLPAFPQTNKYVSEETSPTATPTTAMIPHSLQDDPYPLRANTSTQTNGTVTESPTSTPTNDTSTNNTLKQAWIVKDYLPNLVGRLFSTATDSTLCVEMRKNATARALAEPTFRLLDTIHSAFQTRNETDSPKRCNLPRSRAWFRAARKKPPSYQIGTIEDSCFSYMDVNLAVRDGEVDKEVLKKGREQILTGRHVLFNAMAKMPLPDDGNWTSPYENVAKQMRAPGQICYMDTAMAFRVNGVWFLRVVMTNHWVEDKVPDPHRHDIMEWVPESYEDSLRMIHYDYQRPDVLVNSSNLMIVRGGTMATGTAATGFGDPYGPLHSALRLSEIETGQARDSLTKSNIAIIALPMVMNLIPVSFVEDLNTMGMAVYIIFTDIVSTVPFLIKGIELIIFSRPTETVMTALAGGNTTLSQLEIWVSTCRGRKRFRRMGISFIAIACVAMVGGVTLEFVGFWFMESRRKGMVGEDGDGVYGPFGPAWLDKSGWGLFRRKRRVEEGEAGAVTDWWVKGEGGEHEEEYRRFESVGELQKATNEAGASAAAEAGGRRGGSGSGSGGGGRVLKTGYERYCYGREKRRDMMRVVSSEGVGIDM